MNTLTIISRKLRVAYNRIFHANQYDSLIKKFTYEADESGTRSEAAFEHPAVGVLASEIGNLFIKAGGINYVQFTVFDKASMRPFEVTIRNAERPSPAEIVDQLRMALYKIEAKPDEARSIANEVLARLGYKQNP